MGDPPVREPRSILLVRLSARGDVVFSSAIIPALRARWPDARLTWVVEEAAADYVRHNPRLDRVLVLPRGRLATNLKGGRLGTAAREMGQFLDDLRAESYDLSLDLQGLFRSGLVAFLAGARHRVSLGGMEGSGVFAHQVVSRTEHGLVRPSREYFHLARTLGLDPGDFPMDVALSAEDQARGREILAEVGIGSGGFVALVPFTTRPQKHWFEDRWAALASRIRGVTGLPPLFLGGPGDRSAMERIGAGIDGGPVDLVGRTRLGEAAAVLSHARAVVGVDTGFTHLAVAFRRPTVALFGSTRPYEVTPGVPSRILYKDLPCAPCRKHPTCGGEWTCMRHLSVDRVTTALAEVMEEAPRTPGAGPAGEVEP